MSRRDYHIAVVGVGVRFPGADSPQQFWERVRAAEDVSRDVPDGRWPVPPASVIDPSGREDRVPHARGCFRDDAPGEHDQSAELLLAAGRSAWSAAKTGRLDRSRVGVVAGNLVLPTEGASRLAEEIAFGKEPSRPLDRHSAGLPAIALAAELGLGLGGFTLDAACASSLYAVKLACDELTAGRADAMLAGGVSRPDSLYTQMGFTQLKALSPTGRCRPFDAAGDGLLVGEGAGVFVLKRLPDAAHDGDDIWGVIRAVGLSNDIDGDLLKPAGEGQLRAMRAAYAACGWSPAEVPLVECHATGTPTGDAVEFASLRELRGDSGGCVIGSVKSTVGHLLTAAGSAGLAKVLLAMRHGELPPAANFRSAGPHLGYDQSGLRILGGPRPWGDAPRRAAVSAFGFGGINAHLLVEAWDGSADEAVEPTVNEPVAVVGVCAEPAGTREAVEVPLGRFRIPPTEMGQMLPQQALALLAADAALDDCAGAASAPEKTGVFVGVSQDIAATNFHLRWTGRVPSLPPLTAHRTLGALASVAASRVARCFRFGGPSFTVSAEQASAGRTLLTAVNILQRGEIDRAVVADDRGGAVVLKRLADADGDKVYAVAEEPAGDGAAPSPLTASSIADVAAALREGLRPGRGEFWLADDADRPRRVTLDSGPLPLPAAPTVRVSLREHQAAGREPAGASRVDDAEAIFLVDPSRTDDLHGLIENHAAAPLPVLAAMWWRTNPGRGRAVVAKSIDDLRRQLFDAEPAEPIAGDGRLAFVYPGSGNHFADMGREWGARFPGVLRRQQAESRRLRRQYRGDGSPRDLIFAQVALGTLVTDTLAAFGLKPAAVLGYSLGESASLFGTRAWVARDEMLQRLLDSTLFTSDLAPPYNAAREFFKDGEPIDWLAGVIAASPEAVREHLRPDAKAYLLIINGGGECVVGGHRPDVESLAARLGKRLLPVAGVTLAHCEAARPVEGPYRELHRLPTTPPGGVRFYSTAAGDSYEVNTESAAGAITASVLDTVDFPRVVEKAYADGARLFVEVGPGDSCTRMLKNILGDRPHRAWAVCTRRGDDLPKLLRCLAGLHNEGVSIDLAPLYGNVATPGLTGRTLRIAVPPRPRAAAPTPQPPAPVPHRNGRAKPTSTPSGNAPVAQYATTQAAVAEAHEAYLRFSTATLESFQRLVVAQTQMLTAAPASPPTPVAPPPPAAVPTSLDFNQCVEFARGKIGNVLGPRYGEIDRFPTRVRLPDGPLMLVDRVLKIEAEPLSMTRGRVVTEHFVHGARWYLDNGRVPTCVAVESGQADLFLSAYLGIDFRTRGLATYRLLDAVVTFHRPLPRVDSVIRYDIHIDGFFEQGGSHFFRFRFEAKADGKRFLTMTDGCAGFFSRDQLDAGEGVKQSGLSLRAADAGPSEPAAFAPEFGDTSLSPGRLDALRAGDLEGAFGRDFAGLGLTMPIRLPGGMLSLVHRVPILEPAGGKFGLGRAVGEADIHPDDWFLTCHFVDDQVMPGTLMYECCLHTLRVLLMRLGWVGEEGEVACEPVPGVASRLKCRGQVLNDTKTVAYEVQIKRVEYGPEPRCVADALMYADGKPIVEIGDMSIRFSGLTRDKLAGLWANRRPAAARRVLFDRASITAFAVGKPSEAFGEPYRVFDSGRVIARLPGPPFQFLDRVVRIDSAEPFVLRAGAAVETEYDVPPGADYFSHNRQGAMPFAVLLEVALQPCGWLAAYLGSALTSDTDLSFRNLGGNAVQYAAVGRDVGTLTVEVTMTRVSRSGGMIIQNFDFAVRAGGELVYQGDTYFGFFTKAALANQVGLTGVTWPEAPAGGGAAVPTDAPFPDDAWRMVEAIDGIDGSRVAGSTAVDPGRWFFKAHFHQDPVWPGSLGLESMLQLLKAFAARRWGAAPGTAWQAVALGQKHAWTYRGQVLPSDEKVTVHAEVTDVDDAAKRLVANGLLAVDGRIIYAMTDFSLQQS